MTDRMRNGRIFSYFLGNRKEEMMRPFALGFSVLLFLICTGAGNAQVDTLGRMVLNEGLRYRVAAIAPRIAPGESPATNTTRCVVTSRSGSRVTVNGSSVVVPAQGSIEIFVPASQAVEFVGTQPFAVLTLQTGLGHGEAARHIPSYAWGTVYKPFLWWQDEYGLASDVPTVTTSAVALIADVDDTRVSITLPTGVLDTTLQRGEMWYKQFPVEPGRSRNDSTDYTGACTITSTHPIAVVSGHEKTSVLRHPNSMPKSGNYERAATRGRGNLHDAMLPTQQAGKVFVTTPILYSPTRLRGRDLSLIDVEDDRGDVVRFIVLEDSTIIISRSSNTSANIDTMLHAGDTWYASHVEIATYWYATKPVMCAQYGKSYAYITWQSTQPLDDPSTDAGMPQLQIVPSNEQWIDHAVFVAPSETENFLSLVCVAEDINSILVDGQPIKTRLRKHLIGETPFVAFDGPIAPGEHRITTTNPTATFSAWSYGSIDGLSVGRIYGASTGVNHAQQCDGEPTLVVTRNSDSVQVAYGVADSSDACLTTAMTYFELCNGCAIEERPQGFVVRRTQPDVRVEGVVRTVATNGMYRRAAFALDGTVGVANEVSRSCIAPNPAGEYVVVSAASAGSLRGTYRVWSHIGQCVREVVAMEPSQLYVDLSDLVPGVYRIDGDGVHATIVKQ